MARTFTGLKLQGEIGKFGNIEISDTSGFTIFPDGKVLSGSEAGNLLLWEDNLVKCEFNRVGGKKCHKGMVEAVYQRGHDIISGGRDGVIRVWDFTTIDTAETDDTTVPVDLTMKSKLRVGKSIRSMYPVGANFLVVDSNPETGGIWRADLDGKKSECLQRLHSGAVRCAAFSPNCSLLVTGGDDGYLRLWNVVTLSLIGESFYDSEVTKLLWPGSDFDPEELTIIAGFGDGCIRLLVAATTGLELLKPSKPHTAAVRDIVQAPLAKMLATTSDDGTLFFYRAENCQLLPIGFVDVNGRKPLTKEEITQATITGKPIEDDKEYARGLRIRWGEVVSVECSDGTVVSVSPPSSIATENVETYHLELPLETLHGGAPDQTITFQTSRSDGEVIGKNDGTIIFSGFERRIHSAAITTIAFSSDDSYLCTASEDGEVFLFKQRTISRSINDTNINQGQVQLKKLEENEQKVEDLKKGCYSIEEEKQKSEFDKILAEANRKKEKKKNDINALRLKYQKMIEQNNQSPRWCRVDPNQLKIDLFLDSIAKESAEAKVKEATQSTMFAAEKSRVALRKTKKRLLRDMEQESFIVEGINSNEHVSSFRMTKLSEEALMSGQQTLSEQSENSVDEEGSRSRSQNESTTISTNENQNDQGNNQEAGNKKKTMKQKKEEERLARLKQPPPMKKIIHTPDEHQKMRKIRDDRKAQILAQKPPVGYSDPGDLQAIEIAKNTIGDYKLKDDQNYIAPEEERMNATKKRKQLIQLQKAIYEIKDNFNQKLLNLSNLRKDLIKSIEDTNRELSEIELTIGRSQEPGLSEIPIKLTENEKYPPLPLNEKIEIQLPTPEAIAFAEQVAQAGKRRNEAQAGKQKQQSSAPAHRSSAKKKATQIAAAKKRKTEEGTQLSEVEMLERNELKAQLEYKRERLLANIKGAIERFDQKVRDSATEKVKVTTEVENAELRLIVMLREFKLLAKLEMKDHELNDKLKSRTHDMNAIDAEVNAQKETLKHQEQVVEDAQKAQKKIAKRFDTIVDSSNKFHDQLLKIFQYNIRRNQAKTTDDAEVDISDWDLEAVKKMFEMQSMEKEEDSCPAGCDPSLFERVLELREQKMDAVDQISAAQQTNIQIKEQCDQILRKRKGLETSFNQIKQEFEEFQHQKQRHLNELNFSLALQFHQIQNLETKEIQTSETRAPTIVKQMPSDLSDSLVFTVSGLKALGDQEQHLKAERVSLLQREKADQIKVKEDVKEKENLDKQLEEKAKKLSDIQDLMFGQPVDLVQLEQMRVNPQADELENEIKNMEQGQNAEMNTLIAQIDEATEELTHEIQRNTAVLGNLAELTKQQRDIESVLQDSRNTQTADDLNSDLELANPDELLQEVQKHATLIEKLEEEIASLKSKS